jgi:hypothetical protein
MPSLGDLENDTAIRQSHYTICARVMAGSIEEKRVRGVVGKDFDLTYLNRLEWGEQDSFPKEFAMLRRSDDLDFFIEPLTFYPTLTISEKMIPTKELSAGQATLKDYVASSEESVSPSVDMADLDALLKVEEKGKKKGKKTKEEKEEEEEDEFEIKESEELPVCPPTPTPKSKKKPRKEAVIEEPQPVVQIVREVVKEEPREEPRRLARNKNPKEEKVYNGLKRLYEIHYEGKGEWRTRIKQKGMSYGLPIIEDLIKECELNDAHTRKALQTLRIKGWLEGDLRSGIRFTQEDGKFRYGEQYKEPKPKTDPKKDKEDKKVLPIMA